ncbi:uridylate kinase [Candidatus Methylomicrobium oryzae]|uniref:uridylate kinase n=1 Tax=Candidatus Methylomicrobium oryzae TaxID=2802053 RepID=UPI001923C53A|nr:uridylate kinase [Methylomicrobium sp. RS1]MBL1264011.1 uridylate kinase [Methylomicrobium sp. RS1]
MIVVKLGGSLEAAGTLADCLAAIERKFAGRAVAVVPGGGLFADRVRAAQQRWRFSDSTAHRMAIVAMQQMALLCNGLKPDWRIISRVADFGRFTGISIWSPDPDELDKAGVPATWDITSDSLAAWLAGRLSAEELILVKSAAIDAGTSLAELAERQVVDKAFCAYLADARFKITLINQSTLNG